MGFIQDIYSVREDEGSISISVFSFNSSIDVEVNFTTFQQTAIEGVNLRVATDSWYIVIICITCRRRLHTGFRTNFNSWQPDHRYKHTDHK